MYWAALLLYVLKAEICAQKGVAIYQKGVDISFSISRAPVGAKKCLHTFAHFSFPISNRRWDLKVILEVYKEKSEPKTPNKCL